jgi:hypothetical protein
MVLVSFERWVDKRHRTTVNTRAVLLAVRYSISCGALWVLSPPGLPGGLLPAPVVLITLPLFLCISLLLTAIILRAVNTRSSCPEGHQVPPSAGSQFAFRMLLRAANVTSVCLIEHNVLCLYVYRGMEVSLHPFLTLALEWCELWLLHFGHLTVEKIIGCDPNSSGGDGRMEHLCFFGDATDWEQVNM